MRLQQSQESVLPARAESKHTAVPAHTGIFRILEQEPEESGSESKMISQAERRNRSEISPWCRVRTDLQKEFLM